MLFTLITVCCSLWTIIFALPPQYVLPAQDLYEGEYAPTYDNYQPSDYKFEYAVSDPHTGDHKSQWEVKEKGVVRGMYSLLEPDGTTRIVEYIADDHGFRATVKKLGNSVHPPPVAHYQPESVLTPLPEAYSNHYGGAYSGQAENYVPQQPLTHGPVELHGFTGNIEDDSGYTEFENEEEEKIQPYQQVANLDLGNNNAFYAYNSDHNIGHSHNYVELARPEVISAPYTKIWYPQQYYPYVIARNQGGY